MQYRTLGKSGVRISEIGMGGHREGVEVHEGLARTARFFASDQERAGVVGAAIDAGVNYFDTTFHCEIESLGRSLRILNRRSGLVVSGMRVDFFGNWIATGRPPMWQYVRGEVEKCLAAFGFDHVEQFLCGAMEAGDPLAEPGAMEDALAAFDQLRQEGKIGLLGFSCHSCDYAARLLERFDAFQTVMTPYNFDNRFAEGALAEAIRQRKVGWVAMKTLVWKAYGIPLAVMDNLPNWPGGSDPCRGLPLSRLALQFVIQNPLISSCVPAMNTVEQVCEDVQASGGGAITEEESAILSAVAQAMNADDQVPLGIAGLFESNGRILANAIGLVSQRLKLEFPPINWQDADAETRAQDVARNLLTRLRQMPKWSPLLEAKGAASISATACGATV